MKAEIHPTYYPDAKVTCASCGNTWTTGSTKKELRVDICSKCHPFFSGEAARIIDIEGDPDSPISRGCLCPKGAATFQLVTGAHRVQHVLYRRPHGTEWETIPLEQAMDMVAERIRKTREETWEETNSDGHTVRRTLGIAHMGGATLDNEENYLIKKFFTALGIIQIENQARI